MSPVKVVIADSQYLTRAGLKYLFSGEKQVEVVGEAGSFSHLEKVIERQSPDVIIYDYFNSEHFSIENIQELAAKLPETQFLVITSDADKNNIFKVLKTGVKSILTKHCSKEEILNAVLAVNREEKFFCNKVLDLILQRHIGEETEEAKCAPTRLTNRELEIVELIAQGVTTKAMADQLCLSTHTIYTHRKNIMKKLNINSVSELVLYAFKTGIVKSPQ